MGVGSKWMKPRNSVNSGPLTSNLSSPRCRVSACSSNSGVTEEEVREKLSQFSHKEKENINEIVNTIKGYQDNPHTDQESASKSLKICRVPNNLREIHKHDYDPKLVSIGPFHRGGSHLEAMEEHKKRFLSRLLKSMDKKAESESSTAGNLHQIVTISETGPLLLNNHRNNTAEPVGQEQYGPNEFYSERFSNFGPNGQAATNVLMNLVIEMKKLEAKAKDFYSERFSNFGPNEFVMMMILDGCFIVEFLRLYSDYNETPDKVVKGQEIAHNDPLFNTRWMLPNLQRDLLLFENQLPFFVVEKLFNITSSKTNTYCSLLELIIRFFDPLLPRDQSVLNEKCKVRSKPPQPHHLLAVFHSTFFPCASTGRISSPHSTFFQCFSNIPPEFAERPLIHCVTELKVAGVLFRSREKHDLLDIEFKNGKLYIPPLLINDHTCPVFLNFVAYEQCNQHSEPYFTHYLLFFDSLVNSSKDVAHLHYKGIIGHVLGSDEHVADLFNKLCKEVVHDLHDCYLADQLKNVNQYFYIKVHKWWAAWKHDYFRNPWAFSSFMAAVSLLFLTTIQSFFAVLAYFLPPSTN